MAGLRTGGMLRAGMLALLLVAGCGTTSFYVPVMKPAEVNLLAYKAIAIGEFRNDAAEGRFHRRSGLAEDIADEITRALLAVKKFDVLDRRNFSAILQEQGMSGEGTPWGVRLEKASCLLTGRITGLDYDEQTNSVEIKREGKRPQIKNVRTGMVRMEVVLQITRLSDGRILWNQRMRAQTTGSREAFDAEPGPVDEELLRGDAQAEITADFMRRIMPSEELIPVTFLTDGDIPELEQGIKEAKKGKWEDAIDLFSRATATAAGNEKVHKAWFDLGVAHQYSYDFRKAEEALKKAVSLKDETLYKHQLDYCYDMEREYQEVLKQQQEAE